MAKHIVINRNNGTVTIVRSKLETASEDELTEHEKIINELYNEVEKLNLLRVTVSLPSDKVIEDWYTKDFDSLNVRFWEEAQYCTHGDRVEEIKDALHWFITNNER